MLTIIAAAQWGGIVVNVGQSFLKVTAFLKIFAKDWC